MKMLTYTNGTLIAAYKFAREKGENGIFEIDWARRMDGNAWRRWFRQKLNEKINREDKRTGRKLTSEYYQNLFWDSNRIHEYNRQRVRWSGSVGVLRTTEMQRRYPHINDQRENA
jgi:hypothetical protein